MPSEGYPFELLVKSFLRFDKLQQLVRSVRRFYPRLTIRIADDSPPGAERDAALAALEQNGCVVHRLPTNIGLSAGRNALVAAAQTRYFVLSDDDKRFTSRTRLETLQAVLDADPTAVIAAGMNVEFGLLLRYQHGTVRRDGPVIRRELWGDRAPTAQVGGVRCVPCRLTQNFFMGRTALFRERGLRWDERFKLGPGEHFGFFCDIPDDLRIYVVPEVRIGHAPTRGRDAAYLRYRFDPAELSRFAALGYRVETTRRYESAWLWLRRELERRAGRLLRR